MNKYTQSGKTVLGIAVELGHHKCVKSLIEAGGDVNNEILEKFFTKIGKPSPLMLACFNGHDECVGLLLDAGANVNYGCAKYDTALVTAAGRGYDKCVKLLLEKLFGTKVEQARKEEHR